MKKKIWRELDGCLFLTHEAKEFELLDNIVYVAHMTKEGKLCLTKEFENFSFDYKIYGIETNIIERIAKTYNNNVSKNLGILFNGIKGTGKTVSAKLVCNKLNQPVIIVNAPIPGLEMFLNSIPQNITIFIDEYEKIYERSNEMLTIMDGVMNSEFRRLFILTTNQLRIEDNLLQRPSRIRYLKEFTHLSPKIVEEIVDDILVYKQLKLECIQFIASLELITVDIVKAILQEVNIHNESPAKFENIFNVQKNTGKFNVFLQGKNQELTSLAKSVKIYPRPKFDEYNIGYRFEINDKNLGTITEVLNYDTLRITQYKKNKEGNYTKTPLKVFDIKIENAIVFHSNYRFDYNTQTPMHDNAMENSAEPIIVNNLEERDEQESVSDCNKPMTISDCKILTKKSSYSSEDISCSSESTSCSSEGPSCSN